MTPRDRLVACLLPVLLFVPLSLGSFASASESDVDTDALRERARDGEAPAQRDLGRQLLASEDPAEQREAEGWLQAAAEAGDAGAQAALALAYGPNGRLDRDADAALQWARAAAAQQHPTGEYALGSAYLKGFGIAEDPAQAMEWYQKAAQQGHLASQYHLAVGYARGIGVERDYLRSYTWLVLCSRQLPNARAAKREVARHLSGAQIERAGLDARRIEKAIRARRSQASGGG